MRSIVWFRGKDLRVTDHAPLDRARRDGPVLPLFVLDPRFVTPERAQRWPHRIQFLLDSLACLARSLEELGAPLRVLRGDATRLVPELVRRGAADRVLAHRVVEPIARARDRAIHEALGEAFVLLEGETLVPPGALRTGSGQPYSVFTPFARTFHAELRVGAPQRAPGRLEDAGWNGCDGEPDLEPTPIPSCADLGIPRNPEVQPGGEARARERLRAFVRGPARDYAQRRDRMDLSGTSRLSADLKFGTLSVRQVWTEVERKLGDGEAGRSYLDELVWREFSYSTLWDRPELLREPFRKDFEGFPWERDPDGWRAWCAGCTGYPIVDAGMRQLVSEGFMHNRARMITASFLAKHLLIDFRLGEAFFMRYLTDGDWAQNDFNWQWSAGCGCDAQPYFRIFNPVTQGKKFDPNGDYVRRYVPELEQLPTRYLHAPWEAPPLELESARVRLGKSYPAPIVEHRLARERFLSRAAAHLRR